MTGGSWARTLLPDVIPTASYNEANQQLTLGTKTMTYDLNGNLETLREGDQTTTYSWDVRDRLTGITGAGLSASFAYDAESRRTSKTIAGFSSVFLYDAEDIIKEMAGGQTVNYLRSLRIDETLARIEDGGTTCYVPDALGSTAALADANGEVPTEYTYEPFGRTLSTGAASQNPFQFTGRENDGTGLYYYRARYYHPGLGRFIDEDPIGFLGEDINFYRYVENNPANLTDPSGNDPFKRFPKLMRLCRALGLACNLFFSSHPESPPPGPPQGPAQIENPTPRGPRVPDQLRGAPEPELKSPPRGAPNVQPKGGSGGGSAGQPGGAAAAGSTGTTIGGLQPLFVPDVYMFQRIFDCTGKGYSGKAFEQCVYGDTRC